jgi:hypothetical protein
MIVLVCGGRDYGVETYEKGTEQAYSEEQNVYLVLDSIDNEAEGGITQIIHGGANGADTWAGNWANMKNVPTRVFEAQWRTYGKAAGFKRNIQMAEQDPDLVVAFPGGRGTKMMIDISKKRGLNVRVVE